MASKGKVFIATVGLPYAFTISNQKTSREVLREKHGTGVVPYGGSSRFGFPQKGRPVQAEALFFLSW